jgi:hypothetical protein
MDVTFLEPAGRASENEIDVAGNVTAFKVVPTAIGEDGVLPAKELAVVKGNSIAVNANRQCLANRTGGILEGDILGAKIVRIDQCRRCAKSAEGVRKVPIGLPSGPDIFAFKS